MRNPQKNSLFHFQPCHFVIGVGIKIKLSWNQNIFIPKVCTGGKCLLELEHRRIKTSIFYFCLQNHFFFLNQFSISILVSVVCHDNVTSKRISSAYGTTYSCSPLQPMYTFIFILLD